LYGKGISYTRNQPDEPCNRENIEERIKNHEFDIVIYGSMYRGLPFIETVKQYYEPKDILFVDGEDIHSHEIRYQSDSSLEIIPGCHVFVRELNA